MGLLPAPLEPIRPAFLTRVTPAARLVVGFAWLLVAILTLDPVVPLRLLAADLVVLVLWSGLPLRRVPARLAPLSLAIGGLVVFSVLLSPANSDPTLSPLAAAGPLRITWPALTAGLAIGLRVIVIGLTSLLVIAPTDLTNAADSLAQQWHVPDRFAYSTLAALRVAPFLAGDWTTIGAARRLRGIGGGGPVARLREAGDRSLVMLVASIRRAERMALAMDARGFDAGIPRSHYRAIRTGWRDWLTVTVGLGAALASLVLPR
ncbi:MAG: energy-coupling factor transporter transmembrane component T family protein [Candidatus Limnocylindrales bacterium]